MRIFDDRVSHNYVAVLETDEDRVAAEQLGLVLAEKRTSRHLSDVRAVYDQIVVQIKFNRRTNANLSIIGGLSPA